MFSYILNPENNSLTVYPIKHADIWQSYKVQQAANWTAEEIDFSKDRDDFETLSKDEQHYIKRILGFFAASDGIVNFNLATRFLNELVPMEATVCYTYQMMMENIHSESYSLMLDNLVSDSTEREFLFNSIKNVVFNW